MLAGLSTPLLFAVLAACALAILVLGTRMVRIADRIADITGMGEAIIGMMLLGIATSLAGTVVSINAALDGRASLAFSNGIGGIAAQTAYLAIADVIHRRANLEHASAEATNLFQAALLMLLLSVPLVAWAIPEWTFWEVHPASIVILVVYVGGLYLARQVRERPMWTPKETDATRLDEPDEPVSRGDVASTVAQFFGLMALLAGAGYLVSESAVEIVDRFGVSETVIGALCTAVVTSLPELVTTITAVRRGAMQLAVGGIIGGNTYDVIFLSAFDASYREGSLYHAITDADFMWLAVGMTMTALLLMGLILREREGPFRIGTESVAMLGVYVGATLVQVLWMS
ncbi:sodium:calcium antiporter [Wenxinia saemankumensis]|uniref:Cation:H+ antiporter n=1 Tax=Wenxinia saemankumensis TaxID=1447782 RepID=A0A1M6EXX8_9RHOB|nr:sodium:calcium antiporter [Wenxinia saemankumensis]SHI90285.1 cation:H+ antiporter [Wenxinia saemankumensis]